MRSNGSPFEVLTRRPWRVIKLWIPAAQGLMFNDCQTTREIRRSSVRTKELERFYSRQIFFHNLFF